MRERYDLWDYGIMGYEECAGIMMDWSDDERTTNGWVLGCMLSWFCEYRFGDDSAVGLMMSERATLWLACASSLLFLLLA